LLKILVKINNNFTWLENRMITIVPLLLTILTISAVVNRYFIKSSMSWNEEISIFLFKLLVYWGASNIARDDDHLTVSFLENKLKGKRRSYLKIFIWSISLLISLFGVYLGIKMSLFTTMRTSFLRIPDSIISFSTLVMGFIGISLTCFYKIISKLNSLKEDNEKESVGK
jgi:TRAP-type C4-dicarboxylate transport system permease small subunit